MDPSSRLQTELHSLLVVCSRGEVRACVVRVRHLPVLLLLRDHPRRVQGRDGFLHFHGLDLLRTQLFVVHLRLHRLLAARPHLLVRRRDRLLHLLPLRRLRLPRGLLLLRVRGSGRSRLGDGGSGTTSSRLFFRCGSSSSGSSRGSHSTLSSSSSLSFSHDHFFLEHDAGLAQLLEGALLRGRGGVFHFFNQPLLLGGDPDGRDLFNRFLERRVRLLLHRNLLGVHRLRVLRVLRRGPDAGLRGHRGGARRRHLVGGCSTRRGGNMHRGLARVAAVERLALLVVYLGAHETPFRRGPISATGRRGKAVFRSGDHLVRTARGARDRTRGRRRGGLPRRLRLLLLGQLFLPVRDIPLARGRGDHAAKHRVGLGLLAGQASVLHRLRGRFAGTGLALGLRRGALLSGERTSLLLVSTLGLADAAAGGDVQRRAEHLEGGVLGSHVRVTRALGRGRLRRAPGGLRSTHAASHCVEFLVVFWKLVDS
mmetsp:Transcript_10673/g.26134  ORF Transcript_10673/g.26134 Transcript_10673/m.26134 type:complete len:482 (+) Transcript_10673:712-2157(+)